MSNQIKSITEQARNAVSEYQCSGCAVGPEKNMSCYRSRQRGSYDVSCAAHCPGTIMYPVGTILLGLPKGFNRVGAIDGEYSNYYLNLHTSFSDSYTMFNIPVWKHLNEFGHTIVRFYSPRVNRGAIDIFLENCMDKIDCLEITKEDIDNMD